MMTFLAAIDFKAAIAAYGYLAVFAFICIESLGIPLPGETALITAAIYAGTSSGNRQSLHCLCHHGRCSGGHHR